MNEGLTVLISCYLLGRDTQSFLLSLTFTESTAAALKLTHSPLIDSGWHLLHMQILISSCWAINDLELSLLCNTKSGWTVLHSYFEMKLIKFCLLTCWMTLTRSFITVRRLLLFVMTAVVKYLRMWGQVVWIAFRYLWEPVKRKLSTISIELCSCNSDIYGNQSKESQNTISIELCSCNSQFLFISLIDTSTKNTNTVVFYLQRLVNEHVYN